MKISIVTPCYNAEQFIANTIESIIFQKGDFEIEYIIIDGSSKDRTIEIAEQYQKKINKKETPYYCKNASIKLVSEKDKGMYDALVKGFKMATGEVIAYLNADDFYKQNAFSVIYDLFKNLPNLMWLTGIPTFYNENGIIIECDWPFIYDNDFIRKGLYNNKALPYLQQESIFFRTPTLDCIDFDQLKKINYAGDYYLWTGFSKKYPLFIISAILSGYRMHSKNLMLSYGNSYNEEMKSIQDKPILSENEYDYLLFLHYTWWRESKLAKETNNNRYIIWNTTKRHWKTDHLVYSIDYKIQKLSSYIEFMSGKPSDYAKEYAIKYLL